ncbi:hypothetical protein [Azospirillum palustre]
MCNSFHSRTNGLPTKENTYGSMGKQAAAQRQDTRPGYRGSGKPLHHP